MGSGICGTIATRDVLGLKMKIIGVVAVNANSMACRRRRGRNVRGAAERAPCDAGPTGGRHTIRRQYRYGEVRGNSGGP
jgi:hypothetical protein